MTQNLTASVPREGAAPPGRLYLVAQPIVLRLPGGTEWTSRCALAAARPQLNFSRVQQDFMCTLCGEALDALARAPQAYSENQTLRQLIAKGLTEDQVKRAMVAHYGPAVLAKPPKHGFSLLVYIIPPVVVLPGICCCSTRSRAGGEGPAAARDGRPRRAGRRSPSRTQPARRGTGAHSSGPPRYQRDIESGALTPSSHSDSAITWRAAWESATRDDSTDAGSAPITLQSR